MERLSLSPEGKVVLELRRAWRDGTTHFVFDPPTFIERLAPLMPVIALVACANMIAQEVMNDNVAAASAIIDPQTADALGLTSEAVDAVVTYAEEHRSDGF